MLTKPNIDLVESARRVLATSAARQITFDGKTLQYNPNDHARVAQFTGGDITIGKHKFNLTAVRAVSLREAYDDAADALAGLN